MRAWIAKLLREASWLLLDAADALCGETDEGSEKIARCEHDWDPHAGICNKCGAPIEVLHHIKPLRQL